MKSSKGKLTFLFVLMLSVTQIAYAYHDAARDHLHWVPGRWHYGHWEAGHYLETVTTASYAPVDWVRGHYNRYGYWIPGHWDYRS